MGMRIAVAVLGIAIGSSVVSASCPDVKPLAGVNVTEWSRKSWFIQQQQINGYQSAEDLFCVVATYALNESKKVPFFKGTVLSVHNYETKGKVNGPVESSDVNVPDGLCARQPDNDVSGKLLVAPCFLPNVLAGPYWIIAFGANESTGEYVWGAISGGAPTVQFDDGCTTKETGVNGSGLWIITREQVASGEIIQEARNALTKLGYTLQRLKPVAQKGCSYEGFIIK